jgi:hypothetical protein
MFDLVKKQVSLLAELEKDLNCTFKPLGGRNWVIDGAEDVEKCPFCSHHDCFRVSHVEGQESSSFYKCFSCGEHGDVITWRAKRKGIDLGPAAKELARENGINLPTNYNPVQQVFNLAADYYHNCLLETCDRPFPVLGGKTPRDYQLEVRQRKPDTLVKFKIGFSDGGLCQYLDSLGIDEDIVKLSGLMNKAGRDFLPSHCFIYPHFVKGQVSHFTFKDPSKKVAYQLKKSSSLNGYQFYGQDSFFRHAAVLLVEGENDLLAVEEASPEGTGVIASIGTLSTDQIKWLKENGKGKTIVTLFDPDDAGDEYREKIQGIKPSFRNLLHVRPPEGKDIDELLVAGGNLAEIIRDNLIKVLPKPSSKPSEVLPGWIAPVLPELPLGEAPYIIEGREVVRAEPLAPAEASRSLEVLEQVQTAQEASQGASETEGGGSPREPVEKVPAEVVGPKAEVISTGRFLDPFAQESEETGLTAEVDSVVELADCSVIQFRGCYFKRKFTDGKEQLIRLSNFVLKLGHIFIRESSDMQPGGAMITDRHRELILRRNDGVTSEPFMVDSESKVSVNKFKVLVAKVLDGEWLGQETDLMAMWNLVYSQGAAAEVTQPRRAGRVPNLGSWVFKNVLITNSGTVIQPDDRGIFWINGRTLGVKPEGISDNEYADGIPRLDTSLEPEETEEMLRLAIDHLGKNLNSLGDSLTAFGWSQSSIYSDEIFKANSGMGMLLLWGIGGEGKTTISKWLQSLYGLDEEMAGGSINQLQRTTVGFIRKGGYFSSLPMRLDELRDTDESRALLGMIRSWYDREGRTLASGASAVRTQQIRSTLIVSGEDLPSDPATISRFVTVRIAKNTDGKRETVKSYAWFEEHKHLLSNIGFRWILESLKVSPAEVVAGIRELDKSLIAAGCSKRISKVWAAAGYFGRRLAEKYAPEFDYMAYLVGKCSIEQSRQTNDSTMLQFWETVEAMMARENSRITMLHVKREGKLLYIWMNGIFHEVQSESRARNFTRNAIISAMEEEPWVRPVKPKITMGDAVMRERKTVHVIDLDRAPEVMKRIGKYEEEEEAT